MSGLKLRSTAGPYDEKSDRAPADPDLTRNCGSIAKRSSQSSKLQPALVFAAGSTTSKLSIGNKHSASAAGSLRAWKNAAVR